jgi:hypothetical protein
MVFTRTQAKAVFDYVLDSVLGMDDTSPLKQSLKGQGIKDIFDLCTLVDHDTIADLVYDKSSTELDVPVSGVDKDLVRAFIFFVRHSRSTGNPLAESTEWLAIAQSDFDDYRVGPLYTPLSWSSPTSTTPTTSSRQNRSSTTSTTSTTSSRQNRSSPISTSSTTSSPQATPMRYTPAELFRRDVIRGPNLFPYLYYEPFNDTWHRRFECQARVKGVIEVLDPTYVPVSAEEKDLFNEKLKYVYAILERRVSTERGKAFIREHASDYNAQKVYQKLVEHHLKSTKAMIESSSTLSYITSVRLGDNMWKGTTEAFIIHWENQVRLYERQFDVSDHFSDEQKRTMLENAVLPISELRQVKTIADLEKTKTGRTLTFREYTSLLLTASVAYDEVHKPKPMNRFIHANDVSNIYGDGDPWDPGETPPIRYISPKELSRMLKTIKKTLRPPGEKVHYQYTPPITSCKDPSFMLAAVTKARARIKSRKYKAAGRSTAGFLKNHAHLVPPWNGTTREEQEQCNPPSTERGVTISTQE